MSRRKVSGPRSSVAVVGVPLRTISGTISALGSTQLAAPLPNHRIVVTAFVIQNESAVATTMILREGGLDRWRCLGQQQGDGLAMTFSPGYEWELGVDAVLNYYITGANQCGYSIAYFTERL